MKKFAVLLALAFALSATAEDKEQTLSGKAQCAKCSLKKADSCQMALTTKDGTTYLVENNDVSKKFHKNICTEDKENVKVIGTVKEEGGKKQIVAKEITLADAK
jgi:hypothetical protein